MFHTCLPTQVAYLPTDLKLAPWWRHQCLAVWSRSLLKPHVTLCNFTSNLLPGRVIISQRVDIDWPPSSRDLTPFDFFLWDYLNMSQQTSYDSKVKRDHETSNCWKRAAFMRILKEFILFRKQILRYKLDRPIYVTLNYTHI